MLVTLNVTAMRSEFVGRTFYRLRVVDVVPVGLTALRLKCMCTCGNETYAQPFQLRGGEKKSCGCWKREVLGENTRTHGRANSRVSGYQDRTYGIWQAMRDRCSNPNRKDWHRYGGRGIRVCSRWEQFENFLHDMGSAPPGLTLDRIDNEKGYTPDNCRWASRRQQSYNSTKIVWVTHAGQTRSISDWCRTTGVPKATYYSRRKRGWAIAAALGLTKD